jgi:hypothetical protein
MRTSICQPGVCLPHRRHTSETRVGSKWNTVS